MTTDLQIGNLRTLVAYAYGYFRKDYEMENSEYSYTSKGRRDFSGPQEEVTAIELFCRPSVSL